MLYFMFLNFVYLLTIYCGYNFTTFVLNIYTSFVNSLWLLLYIFLYQWDFYYYVFVSIR